MQTKEPEVTKEVQFRRLLEPIKIGSMQLKNRIVFPPMATKLGTDDGYVTPATRAYYEARAKGGAGMIIVEISCIDFPAGRVHVRQLSISGEALSIRIAPPFSAKPLLRVSPRIT